MRSPCLRKAALSLVALVLAGCAAPPVTTRMTTTTASGVVVETLQAGIGQTPSASDTVRVHYRGTFEDGRAFDSSYERGRPAEFALSRVIRCWTEGLQLVRVGGKARLHCPSATAYGEKGAPPFVLPNTPLVFDIELLLIIR